MTSKRGYSPTKPMPTETEVLGAYQSVDAPMLAELALDFGTGWRKERGAACVRACVGLACFMAVLGELRAVRLAVDVAFQARLRDALRRDV